jgi:hypothetical protein
MRALPQEEVATDEPATRTQHVRPEDAAHEAVLSEEGRVEATPALLRILGAVAVLVVGAVHLEQYLVIGFDSVRVIGTLYPAQLHRSDGDRARPARPGGTNAVPGARLPRGNRPRARRRGVAAVVVPTAYLAVLLRGPAEG